MNTTASFRCEAPVSDQQQIKIDAIIQTEVDAYLQSKEFLEFAKECAQKCVKEKIDQTFSYNSIVTKYIQEECQKRAAKIVLEFMKGQ